MRELGGWVLLFLGLLLFSGFLGMLLNVLGMVGG